MGNILPASVDSVIVEFAAIIPILLFLIGFIRWSVKKFTDAVDERLDPIHRRIDEHMDEEERSLAAHDERLAYLTGAITAIAGSLGVPLEPAPARQIRR